MNTSLNLCLTSSCMYVLKIRSRRSKHVFLPFSFVLQKKRICFKCILLTLRTKRWGLRRWISRQGACCKSMRTWAWITRTYVKGQAFLGWTLKGVSATPASVMRERQAKHRGSLPSQPSQIGDSGSVSDLVSRIKVEKLMKKTANFNPYPPCAHAHTFICRKLADCFHE